MAGVPRPTEFSAGGVVVRGHDVVVIVPTRRAANGAKVLALPKGHVDPGETPIQAAAREVREEAGVDAEARRSTSTSSTICAATSPTMTTRSSRRAGCPWRRPPRR
jgi:8-oxo-dGTP pyrophosphatase MutT (NUDIX family)